MSQSMNKILTLVRENEKKNNTPPESYYNIKSVYDIYKSYCSALPKDQQIASFYNFHEIECSETDIIKFTVHFFLGMFTKNILPKKFAPDRTIPDIVNIILYKRIIDDIKYKLVIEEVIKYTDYTYKSEEKVKAIIDILDDYNTYITYNILDDDALHYILDNTMNYIDILQVQTVKFIKGYFPLCETMGIKPLDLQTTKDILYIIKPDLHIMLREKVLSNTIRDVKQLHRIGANDYAATNIIKTIFSVFETYYKLYAYPNLEVDDDIPYDIYVATSGLATARNIKNVTIIFFRHSTNIYRLKLNRDNVGNFLSKIIKNADISVIEKIRKSFDFDKFNINNNNNNNNSDLLDSNMEEVDGGRRKHTKINKTRRLRRATRITRRRKSNKKCNKKNVKRTSKKSF